MTTLERLILAVASVVFIVGCGFTPDPPGTYFATVRGVDLYAEEGFDTAGLAEETERTIDLALAYWDVPASILIGWRMFFVSEPRECSNLGVRGGCCEHGPQRITLSPSLSCRTYLIPHEIGHIVLPNDRGHADPRWAGASLVTSCW